MTFRCGNCGGEQERQAHWRPDGAVAWQERYECADCGSTGVLSRYSHARTEQPALLEWKL